MTDTNTQPLFSPPAASKNRTSSDHLRLKARRGHVLVEYALTVAVLSLSFSTVMVSAARGISAEWTHANAYLVRALTVDQSTVAKQRAGSTRSCSINGGQPAPYMSNGQETHN
jgi:hypothetical protein